MAVSEFYIRQNDTGEELNAILNDSASTSFSLSGATIVFNMRSIATGVAKIVRASAIIVDATTRQVKYVWLAGDTDVSGDYDAEFEVILLDGRIITFPNSVANMLLVHVTDDIG